MRDALEVWPSAAKAAGGAGFGGTAEAVPYPKRIFETWL